MGIMRNQLLYVTQYDGIHRDRATIAPWWERLLGDAGQIHMAYDAGKDYNFDSLSRYIFHQAGSSIKATSPSWTVTLDRCCRVCGCPR